MAKLVKVIQTHERKGRGTSDDPVRLCPQFWTKDGQLIAEYDPTTGAISSHLWPVASTPEVFATIERAAAALSSGPPEAGTPTEGGTT